MLPTVFAATFLQITVGWILLVAIILDTIFTTLLLFIAHDNRRRLNAIEAKLKERDK